MNVIAYPYYDLNWSMLAKQGPVDNDFYLCCPDFALFIPSSPNVALLIEE